MSATRFTWVPIGLMTNSVMALYLFLLVDHAELACTLRFALLCA
jgi:hypothetical protein